MKTALRFLFSVFLVVSCFNSQSQARCFPPNDFYKYDNINGPSNINEQQFNQIIDAVMAIWEPIAKSHGATLVAEKNWKDSTVNAYADQSGNRWSVAMFGGLARRPEVTPDGFALVVCHELGHHFGGYFFYGQREWAAAEGQADYFATDVCAKRVFAKFNKQNPRYRFIAPGSIKEKCDQAWKTPALQELCYRSSAGGQSLANLLAALEGAPLPNVQTPDPSQVSRSNTEHPHAQCRLDTFFNGALCTAPFDLNVIPGKGLPTGNNSKEAEAAAFKVSCSVPGGFTLGLRPGCWFRQQLFSSLN